MSAHHSLRIAVIGLALCAPVAVKGQQCAPLDNPAFEFQVDVPAHAFGSLAGRRKHHE